WLVAYMASSVFANRDFTELADGEVRLTHPLASHLAHTAALWRSACEPIAEWLAKAFGRAAGIGAVSAVDDRVIPDLQPRAMMLTNACPLAPLPPPLPSFFAPRSGRSQRAPRGWIKNSPVPRMCVECGKALGVKQRKFCSHDCVAAFSLAMNHYA